MIKKNKKLLVAVALNSLAAAYGKNNMQNGQLRHDRLYTGITAQISVGKTDRESYALIEKILKQKTKELEDLYLQSDYILKPEYLSYQIFFSGYYSNISRGKNNGESGSGSADKRVSTADLDIIIPGKEVIYKKAGVFSEIFSNDFNFNIDNNNESPEEYKISGINMSDLSFIPFTQELKIPALFNAANLERVSTGYGQASGIGFMTEGNSILGNSSVAPVAGTTTITVKSGQDVEISGSAFTWNGYNDATRLGYLKNTPTSGVVSAGTYSMYNNTYPHAFLNALAGSYTLSGNWVFVNETTNAYVDNTTNNTVRFISVNHSYGEKDRNTVFNIEPGSVIELYGRNDGHMTVGVEYQSFNALPAVVINEGEIILADGKNLMGASIMLESQRDDTAPRGCLYETTGSSTLNSLCGVLARKPLEESAFLNKNKIVINSRESIGIDFAKYNYDSTKNPLTIYVESGNIDINGSMNYGIRIPNIFMSYSSGEKYFDETVINGDTGIINVAGEKNTGISIGRRISGSAAVTAYNGLVQSDAADIIGNIRNLDIVLNGSQGTGVLRNANFTDKNQGNISLTDTHIKNLAFGDNAQNSVLIRSDKYGVVLEKNLNVNNTNEINNSTENVVMMANDYNNLGSKKTFVENRAVITIGKNLEQTTSLKIHKSEHLAKESTEILNKHKKISKIINHWEITN